MKYKTMQSVEVCEAVNCDFDMVSRRDYNISNANQMNSTNLNAAVINT